MCLTVSIYPVVSANISGRHTIAVIKLGFPPLGSPLGVFQKIKSQCCGEQRIYTPQMEARREDFDAHVTALEGQHNNKNSHPVHW